MTLRPHLLVFATLFGAATVWADTVSEVVVFKGSYCGCCSDWIAHMSGHGFAVATHDVSDVPQERRKLGMPDRLSSCHTARVGAYVIEGHVPASDIERLLLEKPQALGLSVPAMVLGSPGMESDKPVHYDTLLVHHDGTTRIFARH